jgi:hypothetical protein
MKITEKQKKLAKIFKQLEGKKTQDDLIFQAETMLRAQKALKEDYGLLGQDAVLFNRQSPLYADYLPAPMGAAVTEGVPA